MGCGNSKVDGEPIPPSAKFLNAQPDLTHGFQGNLPQKFSLYFTGRKTLKKTDFFALTVQDGGKQQPLYSVTFHNGNTDLKKQTSLFTGTDRNAKPLSVAGIDKWFAPHAYLSVPGASTGPNSVIILTLMKKIITQRFQIPVGPSGVMETFEWRGETMTFAGAGNEGLKPWYLVRMGQGDGTEVVAIWDELKEKAKSGELGTFEFRGSGATGELGEQFRLVAVISWLWILQQRYFLSKALDGLAAGGGLAFMGLGMI